MIFVLNCDVTINLINILIGSIIPVRALFKLDLTSGLFTDQTTFVVVPSMFRDGTSASELLKRLEVNFLANQDKNIYFALLMDFRDSKIESLVSDQNLVDQINEGLNILNIK